MLRRPLYHVYAYAKNFMGIHTIHVLGSVFPYLPPSKAYIYIGLCVESFPPVYIECVSPLFIIPPFLRETARREVGGGGGEREPDERSSFVGGLFQCISTSLVSFAIVQ